MTGSAASCPPQTAAAPSDRGSADDLALLLLRAALAGARALMTHWKCVIDIASKDDGSLVSEADHASDAAVRAALAEEAGEVARWPMVSEERLGSFAGDERFLLLDPLDGTSEFLDHGNEFCVCLAAIERGRPIAAAIAAPALRRAWYAGEASLGLALDSDLAPEGEPYPLGGSSGRGDPRTALVSRRHGDPRSHRIVEACGVARSAMASSAVKFGWMAEGHADIHVRCGPTMAWDIAAGDHILGRAGGAVAALNGAPMRYDTGDAGYRNPPFLAAARRSWLPMLVAAAQRAS